MHNSPQRNIAKAHTTITHHHNNPLTHQPNNPLTHQIINTAPTYWHGERSRCTITTPQGDAVMLSVPLCKHTDGEISYMHKWQHQHWMALVSAYGKTPYFDFYRPYIEPLYKHRYATIDELDNATDYLIDCFLTNTMPDPQLILNPSSYIKQSSANTQLSSLPRFLDVLFEFGPETILHI